MDLSTQEQFGACTASLLDICGVPVSGSVLALRALPPAAHLRSLEMFRDVPTEVLEAARNFAEAERVLFDRACRNLAETRGVRALAFLHGGSNGG